MRGGVELEREEEEEEEEEEEVGSDLKLVRAGSSGSQLAPRPPLLSHRPRQTFLQHRLCRKVPPPNNDLHLLEGCKVIVKPSNPPNAIASK